MHLNVGYNYIFLRHGAKECVCKQQPSYMSSPSYLPPTFKLRIFIIPRYISWVFSNILSLRGHQIAKLVVEYRAEVFSCAVVPYVALKEVAHGMVGLSESRRGVNFCDVICAQCYNKVQFVMFCFQLFQP